MVNLPAGTLLATLLVVGLLAADPNCMFSDPMGSCIACNDKYYLNKGVCTAVAPHCASYDVNTGICNSCEYGYTLTNYLCIAGASGATASNNSATSASMQSLSSSFGSQGSSGTQAVSGQFGQSGAGLTVTNTTTVTTTVSSNASLFCSVPDGRGGCLNCIQGYTLVGNVCVASAQSSQASSQSGSQFVNSQFSQIQPLTVIPTPSTTSSSNSQSQFSNTSITSQAQPIIFNQGQLQTQQVQQQSIPTYQPVIPVQQPQPIQQTQTIQTTTQSYQPIQPTYQPPIQQPVQASTSQAQQTNFQQTIYQQGLQTQTQAQYRQDPYCAVFAPSGICSKCANRYYFAPNNTCVAISGNCNTYDQRSGACTSCYRTFTLYNGECYVQLASTSQSDPNCKTWSGNICQQCYPGYVISNNGCTVGNMLCKTSDNYGNCLSCYPGYTLQGNNCTISAVGNNNPNCANFSNGVCVQCAKGYYMTGGNCLQVSPLCNTYDPNYGNCLSCYPGYTLSGAACVIAAQSSGALNCRNFTNGICVQCSNRYFNLNGVCTPVNDYCNTYNDQNGNCTSCYQGFVLQQGACYKVLVTQTPAGQNWNQVQQGQINQLNSIASQQNQVAQGQGFQGNQTYVFSQNSSPGSLGGSQVGGGGYSSTTTTTSTYSSSGGAQGIYVGCIAIDNQGRCLACGQGYTLSNNNCITSG